MDVGWPLARLSKKIRYSDHDLKKYNLDFKLSLIVNIIKMLINIEIYYSLRFIIISVLIWGDSSI